MIRTYRECVAPLLFCASFIVTGAFLSYFLSPDPLPPRPTCLERKVDESCLPMTPIPGEPCPVTHELSTFKAAVCRCKKETVCTTPGES